MTKPTISVVVPAYNAADTIEKCIESVLNQNYPKDSIEVIAVNDGSTDNTAGMLERYKNRIRIIHQKNMGPAGSRDAGLKAARGDVICTLSSDTYAAQDWFNHLSKAFAEPDVGVVQGKILPYREIDIPFYHMYILKKHVWNYPTAAIAYRGEAVDKAGRYFDIEVSHFGDDTDLAWRIIGKGYKAMWLPVVTAYHDVVPKTFWRNVRSAWEGRRMPLLFKKRPELRRFLKMNFLYSGLWTLLDMLLIFLLPYLFFKNFLYFAAALVVIYGGSFFKSMRYDFYNKCNPVYKLTLIPLNFLLMEIVGFFATVYGSIKYRTLVI